MRDHPTPEPIAPSDRRHSPGGRGVSPPPPPPPPGARGGVTDLLDQVEPSCWVQLRDAELHAVERERALSRLLIDISAACAAAPGLDALVSTYLGRLALGLGTCNGWVAVGRPRRVDVYGVHGLLPDEEAEPLVALLERIGPGVGHGAVAIVPPEDLARIPAADPSGIAVLCGFLRRWRRPGWVLLVGDRSSGLLTEGESVLSATATMIGLAATRLEGTETLWKLSERLEQQVRRRTAELSLERDRLEDRVRERTAELEQAKRSALASERRLLDAEREERVHHLAAGVAHTLNNPLASVLANLDFALEALERPAGSRPLPEAELEEVRQAVTDARMDAGRIDDLVKSSFGDAARARRGAVRTNLGRGVEDAIAHHREATGHRRPILVRLAGKTVVGIPQAALTRWILRILSAAGGEPEEPIEVREERADGLPCIRLRLPHAFPAEARLSIADLKQDVLAAGGRLEITTHDRALQVVLVLPAGTGERTSVPPECRP